jgi:hypothetical protein
MASHVLPATEALRLLVAQVRAMMKSWWWWKQRIVQFELVEVEVEVEVVEVDVEVVVVVVLMRVVVARVDVVAVEWQQTSLAVECAQMAV